ncbi:aminotransferase class V-fold PLP-dependent enzyme [Bacillus sp. V3]|nr:aminotransferase class V-fold PLP-dependent enzyme [Bacillus sp. V3]
MGHQSLLYKIADNPKELQQINQLNYQTFVNEIPQHEENEEKLLVDKFHDENTYIIAKNHEEIVGMIAVRAKRPFSLDNKIPNLNQFIPSGSEPCEVRLLSVKDEYRSTRVFYGLCKRLVQLCLEEGYDLAFISGTVRQLKLYKRIGFIPFASLVGEEDARFQPMYITKASFEKSTKAFQKLMENVTLNNERSGAHSFLPGPVPLHPAVKRALGKTPISHRSEAFLKEIEEIKFNLCRLTQANHAEVVVGTGTLTNDMAAQQLKRFKGDGLILANGEFGFRLIDHAKRSGLSFRTLEKQWGEDVSLKEIESAMKAFSPDWIWTVHCETSTGYLYDLKGILALSKKFHAELCVDACSTVGVVPVDFKECYLATSVSGKGLGSLPGLGIIFHRDALTSHPSIPRYLDIGLYAENGSIPFTHSSNLISSLKEAIRNIDYVANLRLARAVREAMEKWDVRIMGNQDYSPGIITIELPYGVSSRVVGDKCKERGVLLSYESGYLLNMNWVQLALMGYQNEEEVMKAINSIKEIIAPVKEIGYI